MTENLEEIQLAKEKLLSYGFNIYEGFEKVALIAIGTSISINKIYGTNLTIKVVERLCLISKEENNFIAGSELFSGEQIKNENLLELIDLIYEKYKKFKILK